MRITRPRATSFPQLTGVASAVQMGSHVLAAINASVEVAKIANAQLVDIAATKLTGNIVAARMNTNVMAAVNNGGDIIAARMNTNVMAAVNNGGDIATARMSTNAVAALNAAGNLTFTHDIKIDKVSALLDLDSSGGNSVIWFTNDGAANGQLLVAGGVYYFSNPARGAHTFVIDGATGNITVVGTVDGKDVAAMEPSGIIVMWSGAIAAIPAGWILCDGGGGTPNLTDRFVIHADADAAGTRNVGDTGGAMSHTLTTAELAVHAHGLETQPEAAGLGRAEETGTDGALHVMDTAGAGSGNAHAILNKYHALAFIQKT